MKQKTKQSRKYQITINNPTEHGLTREIILEECSKLCLDYFCLSEEVGESGTPHIHIFIYRSSPIRFRTLKKAFPMAHIEQTYGTVAENRDYILKAGKWAESAKASTSVPGTFAEFGDIPTETKSSSSEGTTMEDLLDAVQEGKSTARIIQQNPKFAFRVKDIDAVRQTLLSEQFMVQNRSVKVAYLYGAPGTGKTRGIFDKHGAKNICRVTNYRQGKGVSFDAYYGQDVLVFEEFAGQIPIEEMLNYLDVYPLMLPARYADRVACFTQVYITSNLPLEQQYPAIQRERPATWEAFLRRIQTVVHYESDNKVTEMTMQQWKEHNYDFIETDGNPQGDGSSQCVSPLW